MKIYLELDDTEYEAFKEYCENYKKNGTLKRQCEILREERDSLMKLIEKEIPNKSLIISCSGIDRPATYYLEEEKDG